MRIRWWQLEILTFNLSHEKSVFSEIYRFFGRHFHPATVLLYQIVEKSLLNKMVPKIVSGNVRNNFYLEFNRF